MLVRDFAFKIYKSLLSAPDLVAEEKVMLTFSQSKLSLPFLFCDCFNMLQKKEEEKRQKEEEEKRRKELERQQKEEQKKREEEQKAAAEAAKLNGENTDGQDVKVSSSQKEYFRHS